jgi:hypothetical protein
VKAAVTAYDVHGVVLEVEAPPEVAAVVDARLLAFRGATRPADVAVTYRRGRTLAPPGEKGRPVYDRRGAQVLWFEDAGTLVLDDPAVRAVCRPAAGTLDVDLLADDGATLWLATHGVLTLCLLEILRHRGRYGVHAGSVVLDGTVVLLPGTSGSGKTTLALALAAAGCPLLGDDTAFVDAEATTVLGFPDEVDVTAGTVALLPALAAHLPGRPPPGWPKWPVRPELLGATPAGLTGPPRVLVFPRVSRRMAPRPRPLDRDEALLALVPDVLLTAPDVVAGHLAALAALVGAVPSYALDTGTDLAAAAAAVLAVLPAPAMVP